LAWLVQFGAEHTFLYFFQSMDFAGCFFDGALLRLLVVGGDFLSASRFAVMATISAAKASTTKLLPSAVFFISESSSTLVSCGVVAAVLSITKKSAFASKLSIFFRRPPRGGEVISSSPKTTATGVLLLSAEIDWFVAVALGMTEL
jgi:acyl-CoA hydrolase